MSPLSLSLFSLAGDITQKGYEKKRSKLIGAFFPQSPGKTALLINITQCVVLSERLFRNIKH